MRKVWLVMVVVLLAALVAGWVYYHKPHRSVESEMAIPVSASSLFNDFENNEQRANDLYLNNVLEVNGRVGSISLNGDQKTVIVMETDDPIFGVNCTMNSNISNLAVGDSVTLKGICTGYLSDVVLVQCEIKSN